MSVKPLPSRLDSGQVLQHAFDDETHAIRVNTEATVVAGNIEVAIDHQTDSVKIGDGLNVAGVTSDNSLKVSAGLIKESFDYIGAVHTNSSSIYTYKQGGQSGTVVGIISIIYEDPTRRLIKSLTVT